MFQRCDACSTDASVSFGFFVHVVPCLSSYIFSRTHCRYAGAGIFRHVRLTVTPPVHMAIWGLSVAPQNEHIDLQRKTATVNVQANVLNAGAGNADAMVGGTLHDADGNVVCTMTPSSVTAPATWAHTCDLSSVRLWSPDDPYLYVSFRFCPHASLTVMMPLRPLHVLVKRVGTFIGIDVS